MELLVAMALAALVGVAIFLMHRTAMGAYDQVRNLRRSHFGVSMLIDVLTEDLRSIYLCGCSDENFFFIGRQLDNSETPFLEFSTTTGLNLLARPESTEVRRVRYRLRPGSRHGAVDIIREERPYCGVTMDIQDEDWSSVILVKDVDGVQVSYYDNLTDSYMESWVSDPGQTDRPMRPGAVKLGVVSAGDREPKDILFELPAQRYLARESL